MGILFSHLGRLSIDREKVASEQQTQLEYLAIIHCYVHFFTGTVHV